MQKKSNTIAQEEIKPFENINEENLHQDEAVSDNAECLTEEPEFIYAERIAFYCDLTGAPIYI